MGNSGAYRARPGGGLGGVPAKTPSQIGRGEAQIFPENQLNTIIARQQARADADKKKDAAEAKALEDDLDVATPNILPRDQIAFEKMRKDYYDFRTANINNMDDNKIVRQIKDKRAQLVDFGNKSVEAHKGVIRKITQTSKGDWDNTENIDQLMDSEYAGSADYMTQYTENLGLLEGITETKVPFDLDKDFRQNVLRSLNMAKDRNQTAHTLDNGQVITTNTSELTKDDARGLLDQRFENPIVKQAAESQFKTLDKAKQDKYGDAREWYIQSHTDPFIGEDSKVSLKGGGGGGFSISFGSTTTGLYDFTETTIDTPVVSLATNPLMPMGLDFSVKASRAIDINQLGGKRGKRQLSVFQPGFPKFKILTDPKYLLEMNGKWYVMATASEYKAGKDDPDGYVEGEMIKKSRDYFIPYDDVEDQLASWSKSAKEKDGFRLKDFKFKDGSGAAPQTITAAKIKSLVGTKGYEGHTEETLTKYYTDNGWIIK